MVMMIFLAIGVVLYTFFNVVVSGMNQNEDLIVNID